MKKKNKQQKQNPINREDAILDKIYICLLEQDFVKYGDLTILQRILADLKELLESNMQKFWATLFYSNSLQDSIDLFLRYTPRQHFITQKYEPDGLYGILLKSIMKTIFSIYLRIIDVEQEDKIYAEQINYYQALYEKWIIDIFKLTDIAQIYGEQNPELVKKIVRFAFKFDGYKSDYGTTVKKLFQEILQQQYIDLCELNNKCLQDRDLQDYEIQARVKALYLYVDQLETILVWIRYFEPELIFQTPNMALLEQFFYEFLIARGYERGFDRIEGAWKFKHPNISKLFDQVIEYTVEIFFIYFKFIKARTDYAQTIKSFCEYIFINFGLLRRKNKGKKTTNNDKEWLLMEAVHDRGFDLLSFITSEIDLEKQGLPRQIKEEVLSFMLNALEERKQILLRIDKQLDDGEQQKDLQQIENLQQTGLEDFESDQEDLLIQMEQQEQQKLAEYPAEEKEGVVLVPKKKQQIVFDLPEIEKRKEIEITLRMYEDEPEEFDYAELDRPEKELSSDDDYQQQQGGRYRKNVKTSNDLDKPRVFQKNKYHDDFYQKEDQNNYPKQQEQQQRQNHQNYQNNKPKVLQKPNRDGGYNERNEKKLVNTKPVNDLEIPQQESDRNYNQRDQDRGYNRSNYNNDRGNYDNQRGNNNNYRGNQQDNRNYDQNNYDNRSNYNNRGGNDNYRGGNDNYKGNNNRGSNNYRGDQNNNRGDQNNNRGDYNNRGNQNYRGNNDNLRQQEEQPQQHNNQQQKAEETIQPKQNQKVLQNKLHQQKQQIEEDQDDQQHDEDQDNSRNNQDNSRGGNKGKGKQWKKQKGKRKKHIPQTYSIEEEQALLDHHIVLLLDLLKHFPTEEDIYTALSHSAIIFKRFYLRYSIFEQPELQQIGLLCTYLGLKINDNPVSEIQQLAHKQMSKQKHKGFTHYGCEEYSRKELALILALNYQIDIKPIMPIVVSISYVLQIAKKLGKYLYPRFINQAQAFFIKSLRGNTIFIYNDGLIAAAIVESSLQVIISEQQNTVSKIVGPSNRPVDRFDQEKIKELFDKFKKQQNTVIELLEFQIESRHLNFQQLIEKLELKTSIQEIKHLSSILLNTPEIPKSFEAEWRKYNEVKRFEQPIHEIVKVPKFV